MNTNTTYNAKDFFGYELVLASPFRVGLSLLCNRWKGNRSLVCHDLCAPGCGSSMFNFFEGKEAFYAIVSGAKIMDA